MGRQVGGRSDIRNVTFASLNATIKGNVVKTSVLNCAIAGTVSIGSSLNALVSNYTSNSLSSSLNSHILSTLSLGLIGYFKFEGGTTSEVGSVTGVATNVSLTSGKIGQAASFNGSSSTMSLSPNLSVNKDYTVSMWMYPTSDASSWQTVTGLDTNQSFFRRPGGAITLYPLGDSSLTATINTWSHVVFRATNGAVNIFINGVKDPSTKNDSRNMIFKVVGSNGAGSEYFPGTIDELGFWNRPLSDAEVASLYNSGSGVTYPL